MIQSDTWSLPETQMTLWEEWESYNESSTAIARLVIGTTATLGVMFLAIAHGIEDSSLHLKNEVNISRRGFLSVIRVPTERAMIQSKVNC